MKNLIIAAVALAAVAGTASASGQTPSRQLSAVDAAELRSIVPNANVDNLTAAQIASVRAALYGGDKGKGAAVRAALQ